ncbi:MAG: homoserine O-succinyltransferase [Ignavibacteriaceae bacterium]|nr:homoserine O-succinyltransferase [Ignavibacteriaceae bacterium]
MNRTEIKAAIIDLYNNEENLGIGAITNLLTEFNGKVNGQSLVNHRFETRYKAEVPDLSYDIYISSGGPGSPFEGEGTVWEKNYFDLLDKIWNHNQTNARKKYLFFICHSFQMMARFFNLGAVTKRKSRSFGIFPVHKTEAGTHDPILKNLPEPFFAADFRWWQVIQPNNKVFHELGAKILALEKIRPHVEYERALMAVRISPEIFGTQFHPEAHPEGMRYHYQKEGIKQKVINDVGEKKYYNILEQLEDPEKVELTQKTVLPLFLEQAIKNLV